METETTVASHNIAQIRNLLGQIQGCNERIEILKSYNDQEDLEQRILNYESHRRLFVQQLNDLLSEYNIQVKVREELTEAA